MQNLENNPIHENLSDETLNEKVAKSKGSGSGLKRRFTALAGMAAMFGGGALAQERPRQVPNRKAPAAAELQTKKESSPNSIEDFIKKNIPQEAQEKAKTIRGLLDNRDFQGQELGADSVIGNKLTRFQFLIDDMPKEDLDNYMGRNPKFAEDVKAAKFLGKASLAFRNIKNDRETWDNALIWAKDRKEKPDPKTWETLTTDIAKQYAIIAECLTELQQIGIENLKKAVADINEK